MENRNISNRCNLEIIVLDNYIGISYLVSIQVAILPALGPLISKLLIGHKCKIRVRTSACGSTVGVLCGQLVNRYELHID